MALTRELWITSKQESQIIALAARWGIPQKDAAQMVLHWALNTLDSVGATLDVVPVKKGS